MWDPPESFFHLIILEIDDALVAEAGGMAPDPARFTVATGDDARRDLRIELNGTDDAWIDRLVERHALPAERLLVAVSCVSLTDFNRVRVPEPVLELLCRLNIRQVEFSYLSHDTTDYFSDDE